MSNKQAGFAFSATAYIWSGSGSTQGLREIAMSTASLLRHQQSTQQSLVIYSESSRLAVYRGASFNNSQVNISINLQYGTTVGFSVARNIFWLVLIILSKNLSTENLAGIEILIWV